MPPAYGKHSMRYMPPARNTSRSFLNISFFSVNLHSSKSCKMNDTIISDIDSKVPVEILHIKVISSYRNNIAGLGCSLNHFFSIHIGMEIVLFIDKILSENQFR